MATQIQVFRPRLIDKLTRLFALLACASFFCLGSVFLVFSGFHPVAMGVTFLFGLGTYWMIRGFLVRVVVTSDSLCYRSTPLFPGGFTLNWSDVVGWDVSRKDNDVSIPFVRFETARTTRYIYDLEVSHPGFDQFVSVVSERLADCCKGEIESVAESRT